MPQYGLSQESYRNRNMFCKSFKHIFENICPVTATITRGEQTFTGIIVLRNIF